MILVSSSALAALPSTHEGVVLALRLDADVYSIAGLGVVGTMVLGDHL